MKKYSFMNSLLTFYLKGEISIEQDKAVVKSPNTIFKLIPLGANNYSIPVSQIAGVNTSFSLDVKSLLIGLVLALLGFANIKNSIIFLIFGLIGLGMAISAFTTIVQIEKTSGSAMTISFCIFDKKVAEQIGEELNNIVNTRTSDTNYRVHSTKNADRIIEAIKNK